MGLWGRLPATSADSRRRQAPSAGPPAPPPFPAPHPFPSPHPLPSPHPPPTPHSLPEVDALVAERDAAPMCAFYLDAAPDAARLSALVGCLDRVAQVLDLELGADGRLALRAVGEGASLAAAVGGLAVLVSGTVIGAITQHFTGPFTSTAGDALSSMADNRLMFVLLSLGVGVIAPIVEEVCFRGLLWGSLAKRGMNPWWATAISALIFALFHFEPVRLPLLFATGLILGFLRQRTGRLGAGMLAHMINNSAALLAFALT